jgi:hypothetical protein
LKAFSSRTSRIALPVAFGIGVSCAALSPTNDPTMSALSTALRGSRRSCIPSAPGSADNTISLPPNDVRALLFAPVCVGAMRRMTLYSVASSSRSDPQM